MADKEFSQFINGSEVRQGDQVVGLRSSKNHRFDFPGEGIKDGNGNYLFKYASQGASSVNYPKLTNSLTAQAVVYGAEGTDTNIDVSIEPKGNGGLILDDLRWPTSDGASGTFMRTDGSGNLSFTSSPVVTDVEGTENQVLVNGTFGTPTGGSITLTLPQDIATTSTPTFQSLTLTNPLALGSGGTGKALTAANGGIVYSDADSLEILAPTATARQMVQSGANGAPSFSTSTWPDTTTINRLLYSSANNTVSEIATANSAILYTNSSGVPALSASMTNGQVMIGSTGASPLPATLTAGTGVSITNAANSITINASGGGMAWTEVTGTSQAMSPDNGYIANNNLSLITLSLPTTAALGTTLSIVGKGSQGWAVSQGAGQSIRIGNAQSTAGAFGSIASTNQGDSINLVCTTANTVWTARGAPQGNITLA